MKRAHGRFCVTSALRACRRPLTTSSYARIRLRSRSTTTALGMPSPETRRSGSHSWGGVVSADPTVDTPSVTGSNTYWDEYASQHLSDEGGNTNRAEWLGHPLVRTR